MQYGDIIAVRGNALLSHLIVDFSGPISHVGAITSLSPPLVTQALSTVETLTLDATLASAKYAYVLSPLNVTDVQRDVIVNFLLAHVGEAYDYADLAWQAADIVSGSKWFTQHLSSGSKVICSELVAQAYGSIGLNFGVARRSATPTEIFNYALANPKVYSINELK